MKCKFCKVELEKIDIYAVPWYNCPICKLAYYIKSS
jgi:hypothetical protein